METTTANLIPIGTLSIMFFIGFLGVLLHWSKMASNKLVSWNLFEYLFVDHKGRSSSMFSMYVMSMIGLYQLGAFDNIQLDYILEAISNGALYKPFMHAIIETISAGYVCDSAFNKGKQVPIEKLTN